MKHSLRIFWKKSRANWTWKLFWKITGRISKGLSEGHFKGIPNEISELTFSGISNETSEWIAEKIPRWTFEDVLEGISEAFHVRFVMENSF